MADHNYEYLGRRPHGTIMGHADDSSWNKASFHRAHIQRMISNQDSTRRGILCIAGIGDGTALDFQSLLERFHEVHVIERNEDAVERAIKQQNLNHPQRVFHQAVDVTGAHELLEQYASDPSIDGFEELCQKIQSDTLSGLGKFDVVLSNSQIPKMTCHATDCIPGDADRLLKVVKLLRDCHIDLLARHTVPGGKVVLIVDIVSSRTLPVLSQSPEDLNQVMHHALQQGNFFPGAHPTPIDMWFGQQGDRFARVDVTMPWIRETSEEHLACIGFRASLTGAGDS